MLHRLFTAAIQRSDLIASCAPASYALGSDETKMASLQFLSTLVAGFIAELWASVLLSATGVAVTMGFSAQRVNLAPLAVLSLVSSADRDSLRAKSD